MRINVPVLHPLDPVYRTVPVSEGLVYVAPFVIVVLHVRVHLSSDVGHWTSEQTLHDIGTDIVQIIRIVIDCA